MFGAAVTVVAAPAAGIALVFKSAVLIYDFDTAAFTGGGDIQLLNPFSGGALSSTISAANGFGNSADSIFQMVALDTAGGVENNAAQGIQITNLTGAFVDPGTAAGVARLIISYYEVTTGL